MTEVKPTANVHVPTPGAPTDQDQAPSGPAPTPDSQAKQGADQSGTPSDPAKTATTQAADGEKQVGDQPPSGSSDTTPTGDTKPTSDATSSDQKPGDTTGSSDTKAPGDPDPQQANEPWRADAADAADRVAKLPTQERGAALQELMAKHTDEAARREVFVAFSNALPTSERLDLERFLNGASSIQADVVDPAVDPELAERQLQNQISDVVMRIARLPEDQRGEELGAAFARYQGNEQARERMYLEYMGAISAEARTRVEQFLDGISAIDAPVIDPDVDARGAEVQLAKSIEDARTRIAALPAEERGAALATYSERYAENEDARRRIFEGFLGGLPESERAQVIAFVEGVAREEARVAAERRASGTSTGGTGTSTGSGTGTGATDGADTPGTTPVTPNPIAESVEALRLKLAEIEQAMGIEGLPAEFYQQLQEDRRRITAEIEGVAGYVPTSGPSAPSAPVDPVVAAVEELTRRLEEIDAAAGVPGLPPEALQALEAERRQIEAEMRQIVGI